MIFSFVFGFIGIFIGLLMILYYFQFLDVIFKLKMGRCYHTKRDFFNALIPFRPTFIDFIEKWRELK